MSSVDLGIYEIVFIIRQDASSTDVDRITQEIIDKITSMDGKILKKEYWGLRHLAYKVNNNTRGNYMFLVVNIGTDKVAQIEKKVKFLSEVVRYNVIRVKEFDEAPSPLLRTVEDNIVTNFSDSSSGA